MRAERSARRPDEKGTSMAIGWLTVLKSVPWTEVISNAPKVAAGAKKLWQTVARNPSAPEVAEHSGAAPETRSHADLVKQVDTLAAATTDLHQQMLESSQLIKALAEQNAQLVERIEANRVRVRWLTAAVAAAAVLAGLALVLAM
jgi:hypothetical protein